MLESKWNTRVIKKNSKEVLPNINFVCINHYFYFVIYLKMVQCFKSFYIVTKKIWINK